MATPNVSEIVATTIENRSKKLADNVSDNNALLSRLNERGKIKPFSGGRVIYQELDYAENGTYTRYQGYDPINISPQEVFTAAEFDLKQVAVSVSISGLEELQNSGPEQMIDLLEARIENAERSMQNGMAADVYSDGTANGSKQIGGLQLLVPDDPTTGTAGGINRATWSFWRSVVYDATTDGGAAVSTTNIQSYMNSVYVQLVRGRDAPDLIVADNNYFKAYLGSLQTIQRITNEKLGQAGFVNLKYMNADVVLDGGIGGNTPTNHMYFLNTNYLFLRPHRDRNMRQIDGKRFSLNQDAMVQLIGWAGNMTASGLRYQGLLKD